jgi:hypothetical protein
MRIVGLRKKRRAESQERRLNSLTPSFVPMSSQAVFVLATVLLTVILLPYSQAGQQEPPDIRGPVVREPVAPRVQSKTPEELPAIEPMKPEDPVRVMPDLKEAEPIIQEPVSPKVQRKNLKELPCVEPAKPDDPIRVMPDLKETDRSNPR